MAVTPPTSASSGINWGDVGTGAVSAGISAGLDAVGGNFSAKQQYRLQKRLYKHRYQWQVKDMQKAGLNPMLAFSQGAPVPGGVSAPDYGDIGSRAVSSAVKAMDMQAMRANIDATNAQESLTREQAKGQEIKNLIDQNGQDYQDAVRVNGGEMDYSASAASRRKLAETSSAEFKSQLDKINRDAAQGNLDAQKLDIEQRQTLNKIKIDYDRAMQKAAELKLPELEAAAAYWSEAGVAGKVIELVMDLIPGGSMIFDRLVKKGIIKKGAKIVTRGPR